MMKSTTKLIMSLLFAVTILTGCGELGDTEWVADYRIVWVENIEDTDIEIWVDGEYANTIPAYELGRIGMPAGTFQFEAKLTGSGTSLGTATCEVTTETEENRMDLLVFNYSSRSYAVVDCNYYYESFEEPELKGTFFNQGFFEAESEGAKIYMSHSPLPWQITEGKDVYKLVEIPASLEGDDEAILDYATMVIAEEEG